MDEENLKASGRRQVTRRCGSSGWTVPETMEFWTAPSSQMHGLLRRMAAGKISPERSRDWKIPALFVHCSSFCELVEPGRKFIRIHLIGPALDVLGRGHFAFRRLGNAAHLRAADGPE